MKQLTEIAQTTLTERYLLRDEKGEVCETPEGLFRRVAKAIAAVEKLDGWFWEESFFSLMANGDFLPNTPTLINAGREGGQLSACFVLPIEDSMDGIFKTLHDMAIVHKTGGGTGFDFSSLRPEGAMVSNKTGVSTGPLSFAKVYDAATNAVKQGATRRGANMMTFSVHHPDILDFLDMKMPIWDEKKEKWVTSKVMNNFNVSVTVTDAFMDAVEKDEEYDLFHPYTGKTGTLKARDVWHKIAHNAHTSAEPGLLFIDRINEKSPYEETITATNPCGEQPLPPYGACNLGSINLSNFVSDKKIDWTRLKNTIQLATRFLDNVIDANTWPREEIKQHAEKYRNIGLGYMGFADALLLMGISYNSPEGVALAESLSHFLNKESHEYSMHLAEEKGLPSGAPFKTFFSYSSPYRRNATLTTMAPTGSISMIAGCSGSGEPVPFWEMERHQMDMVLTEMHWIYKKAKEEGWYTEELFVASHDVDPHYHVAMQAAFQKHCDSAVSKTINLPKTATVEDVQAAYKQAYTTGCKGITVYRDGSREGVLHKLETADDVSVADEIIEELCCETPHIVSEAGCEVCKHCGTSKCLVA